MTATLRNTTVQCFPIEQCIVAIHFMYFKGLPIILANFNKENQSTFLMINVSSQTTQLQKLSEIFFNERVDHLKAKILRMDLVKYKYELVFY